MLYKGPLAGLRRRRVASNSGIRPGGGAAQRRPFGPGRLDDPPARGRSTRRPPRCTAAPAGSTGPATSPPPTTATRRSTARRPRARLHRARRSRGLRPRQHRDRHPAGLAAQHPGQPSVSGARADLDRRPRSRSSGCSPAPRWQCPTGQRRDVHGGYRLDDNTVAGGDQRFLHVLAVDGSVTRRRPATPGPSTASGCGRTAAPRRSGSRTRRSAARSRSPAAAAARPGRHAWRRHRLLTAAAGGRPVRRWASLTGGKASCRWCSGIRDPATRVGSAREPATSVPAVPPT